MIPRAYEPLEKYIHPSKVLIIYGPRQVGKTTLLQNFLARTHLKYKLDTGENIRTQQLFAEGDLTRLLEYVAGYQLLAIDEAQTLPNAGLGLKLIVDHAPQISIIVTGSSSFELAGQLGEPLTGRKRTLTLYPLAQSELLAQHNRYELQETLPDFLVFGAYPEVITAANRQEKIEAVTEITNSYLLKDILAFDRVRNSRTLLNLLQLLAFQVGAEVSLNELANKLNVSVQTVQRYLDLLEKTFVIVRLGGFSRNLRDEITSKAKYYFFDNGIRNAVIAQFNNLSLRNDVGALWENFIFIERLKHRTYRQIYANIYFWRTYAGREIDLIEERDGQLFGYEFKWSGRKKVSAPKKWLNTYANASFAVINPDNYLKFVLPKKMEIET